MSAQVASKKTVWSGAIMGGIVNATMTAQSATYQACAYWHRNHYYLNGGDGREGVITFAGGHWYADAPLVGVFHDTHGGLYRLGDELPLERFFAGCSEYHRALAEQAALRYLQQAFHGVRLHRVTTAFWDEQEHLRAADLWETVISNGASLITNELFDDEEAALAAWQADYGMSSEQISFARTIFHAKIARPPSPIELTPSQVAWLDSICEDDDATTTHRLWRDMLQEIGVELPNEATS